MSEYLCREELLGIAAERDNLRVLCQRLIKETDELTKELAFARQKLIEVQERNRKLDWLLTKAVEL